MLPGYTGFVEIDYIYFQTFEAVLTYFPLLSYFQDQTMFDMISNFYVQRRLTKKYVVGSEIWQCSFQVSVSKFTCVPLSFIILLF